MDMMVTYILFLSTVLDWAIGLAYISWAHILGRQTPLLYSKCGGEPQVKPGVWHPEMWALLKLLVQFDGEFLFGFCFFCFRFFWFVSKQICLFLLFRNGSETPKQTETNRKNNLLVSRNKPKMNRNRLCFGLFRFEPKKKIWLFRGHPNF
jgi:hypothetical protein